MTPTRTRTRTAAHERRAATERAILQATEQLLEQLPFRDLTVEDVMSKAGLTRTAFYRYFPDLESVVVRLMGQLVDELHAASAQWFASNDPAAQLHVSLRQFAAVYRDHGRLMQAFYDAAGAGPDLKELWGTTISELIAPVEAHTRSLMAAGQVDVEYPVETIRALSVLTDRYLLDVYWKYDTVPPERPAAVLEQIWLRTLRLR
jgi:TetR/AcrR family transcriptional regulator, ethionamide resistance regulator